MKTEHITAIQADGWRVAEGVAVDNDTFTDGSWSGCDYRITTGFAKDLAVNIHITGRKSFGHPSSINTYIDLFDGVNREVYKTRAKIEFVRDGEESEFVGGIVYSDVDLVALKVFSQIDETFLRLEAT